MDEVSIWRVPTTFMAPLWHQEVRLPLAALAALLSASATARNGPLSGSATKPIRYTAAVDMTGLPGADLVEQGLRDLAAGHETEAALLVLIGEPRLRRLGFIVSEPPPEWSTTPRDPSPEHRLYALLARSDGDAAHSRYNALIRTLVSFERAGECVR